MSFGIVEFADGRIFESYSQPQRMDERGLSRRLPAESIDELRVAGTIEKPVELDTLLAEVAHHRA